MFDLFYADGIATISEIYYIPYYKTEGGLYYAVYITVNGWHDTEVAYNFIKKLKKSSATLLYDNVDELSWPVYILDHKRPSNGYSIINYLIHPDNDTFQTLDLSNLKQLDKQFDLLTL